MLNKIHNLLNKLELDSIIISNNDNFFNENTELQNNLVYGITKFKGSNATIIIEKKHNHILFYTDGRYLDEAKLLFQKNKDYHIHEYNLDILKKYCNYITAANGGERAVTEAVFHILDKFFDFKY